jgi:hypothetical protein
LAGFWEAGGKISNFSLDIGSCLTLPSETMGKKSKPSIVTQKFLFYLKKKKGGGIKKQQIQI